MRIGDVLIPNQLVSAPMAGVSDKAYRLIVKSMGAGLVFTEMVSAKGLVYGDRQTKSMLDLTGEGYPLAVQVFASEPEVVARAAPLVEACGAAILDINMGCPVSKIVKNGEGAALMRDVSLAAAMVRAAARAVRIPVTVKMRSGWDQEHLNAVEMAGAVAAAGARAVTVHARSRDQFYSGRADWEVIARVKAAVDVPVIGNGDVLDPRAAKAMLEETGCDAVMLARGALGNPWLFERSRFYLEKDQWLPEPAVAARAKMAIHHLGLVVAFKGERIAVQEMKKHISWYLKGARSAARLREQIMQARSRAELEMLLAGIADC